MLIRLLWRSRRSPNYKRRWSERFGFFKMDAIDQGGIWVHVVSVGETLAAAPLIHALHKRYPQKRLIVTTMTPTGSERVKTNLPSAVFHVYIPYDLPGAVSRFLNKTKPSLAIFMETELWPNILHQCQKRHIPTLLANARLSEKSRRGYQRFQPLAGQMVRALTVIAAQARADADRFIALGAKESHIKVVGNVKFDMQIPNSLRESAAALRHQLGDNRFVFIAASTHEGEEEQVLEAFQLIRQSVPQCLLIMVPRHLERFDKVAQLCKKAGYRLVRRSEQAPNFEQVDVYLGDTMGELRLFLGASDVAFIGGSLIERGGHNMMEAAAFAIPVLSGPHIFNFAEVTRLLTEANALMIVKDAAELATRVERLSNDSVLRQEMGEKGQAVVDANRGALDEHLKLIEGILKA